MVSIFTLLEWFSTDSVIKDLKSFFFIYMLRQFYVKQLDIII